MNTKDTVSNIATNSLLPVYNYLPLKPVRGDGLYLFDESGRPYLDFYGGHAVALLGYNHPRLVSTLTKQASELFFQSNIVALDVREKAAAALTEFSQLENHSVFFVNSGAEANENALRLACRATGKDHVVALKGGFHGRTAAVAAATSSSESWYGFPSRPFKTTFVDPNSVEQLTAAIGSGTAAVIMEPVMGMAGAVSLSKDFLTAARTAADNHGAVLIFDEVQCGMGRSGYPFVANEKEVTPDILTVAKGIAGGYPAAAMLIKHHLSDVPGKGELGTTFGGAPMACALVTAVIDTIREENLLENVRSGSAQIKDTCVVGPVESISGSGYLLGLHTVTPAREVQTKLLDAGIVTGLSKNPNVVRLLPPLTLGSNEIQLLHDALQKLS
ncbi:MAG: aspartate aminotransferase family protein [Rhodothermales bacterium]|nr:aspartate aminotransferase family protein [Rhodothermales bacterium]